MDNTAGAGVVYAQAAGTLGQCRADRRGPEHRPVGRQRQRPDADPRRPGPKRRRRGHLLLRPQQQLQNTGLNTASNMIQVSGGTTATPAGQIIGPWATVGTANGEQRDYAVYNASGQVVAANGTAHGPDTTWTSPSQYYTIGSGTQPGHDDQHHAHGQPHDRGPAEHRQQRHADPGHVQPVHLRHPARRAEPLLHQHQRRGGEHAPRRRQPVHHRRQRLEQSLHRHESAHRRQRRGGDAGQVGLPEPVPPRHEHLQRRHGAQRGHDLRQQVRPRWGPAAAR